MRESYIKALKVIVFIACLIPLGLLGIQAIHGKMGTDPVAHMTHLTGKWTLRFLLITLAVTPVRKLTRMNWLIRFRRMLGLYAFFYGSLHLLTYVWFDKFFNLREMLTDIAHRRFITAGLVAWTLMVPLAATSTLWAIRKLGGRRWQLLHRLIYISACAAIVHYWWLVKPGVMTPTSYTLILLVLLLLRPVLRVIDKLRSTPTKPAPQPQLQAK